jgi:hypothetical protein
MAGTASGEGGMALEGCAAKGHLLQGGRSFKAAMVAGAASHVTPPLTVRFRERNSALSAHW